MATPVIMIFVRHGVDKATGKPCRYSGDESARRCNCPKWLRWTQDGKQYREATGVRSWAEAEEIKQRKLDQITGRNVPAPTQEKQKKELLEAINAFVAEKRIQGVSGSVVAKYERELKRLRLHCQTAGVYVVQGMAREVLAGYCGTWAEAYPSSVTRSKVRERLRTFLRYCYEAGYLERIPGLPKIKVDETPTMPLVGDEYDRLLEALPRIHPLRGNGKPSSKTITAEMLIRVRALVQLMRWSGLAIGDAVTLERLRLAFDERHQLWRVTTARQKTGTHVSVVIPPDVAAELLAAWELSPNKKYVFWAGKGKPATVSCTWAKRYIRPAFVEAQIPCDSHMVSHRLRDTFAVDLLEKGVPLEEVSKALGHESIKTTEKHYAKWVKSRQDRLDSLVMGAWEQKPKERAA